MTFTIGYFTIDVMKISLVSTDFVNNDIQYNFNKIITYTIDSSKNGSDMVCFGETFLQGFDSLSWNYETDKEIAVTNRNPIVKKITEQAAISKIAIGFGYLEKDRGKIFSSYLIIDKQGKIIDHYRRVSPGWKVCEKTDYHYQEGKKFHVFDFNGIKTAIMLCGDLWYDENIAKIKKLSPDLILWPVYVNFSLEEWAVEEKAYALQANKTNVTVLMINSISRNPDSFGGCCYFSNGETVKKIDFGIEGVLEYCA